MKRYDAGCCGHTPARPEPNLTDVVQTLFWPYVLNRFLPAGKLRPLQAKAFGELKTLDSRRNLLVSAPTNSGKTLIGYSVLFDALRSDKRAVLVEPLRALAQEKADELSAVFGPHRHIQLLGGTRVRLATGDYRLEDESFSSAPSGEGEVVIATPERLDSIFRDSDNLPWLETVGSVVIDEAHLIGDQKRGPTLELVLASLRLLPSPPRLCLLSATIGGLDRLRRWLDPCDVLETHDRFPPLAQEVLELEDGDPADEILAAELKAVLSSPQAAALVFVYRRDQTEALARRMSQVLPGIVGPTGALAYHSGLSSSSRSAIRAKFASGESRLVFTTTSLALGVNLPATHVYVRDVVFPGAETLNTSQLRQMLGRAGRGDQGGVGVVLVRQGQGPDARSLAAELREGSVPDLRSAFEVSAKTRGWRDRSLAADDREEPAANIAASVLARYRSDGRTVEELSSLLGQTLAGPVLGARAASALRLLERDLLAHRDEGGRWKLTTLGSHGVRAVLPLPVIAGTGRLLRDLLSIDQNSRLLAAWNTLDHLIVLTLLSDRVRPLRRFSEKLAERVDTWLESAPQVEKSLLAREWICAAPGHSRAEELLGSLGIKADGKVLAGDTARAKAYSAVFHATVLMERSKGVTIPELERSFGIEKAGALEGAEESWRDEMMWLLSGLACLYDVRCFFFHLRTACDASDDRIRQVRSHLIRMRIQALTVRDQLKYCSALGPALRGIRNLQPAGEGPRVGVATIRKLEEAGIRTIPQLVALSGKDLRNLGIRSGFAKQIQRYSHRRMM